MSIPISTYAKRNGYKKQTVYKRVEKLKKEYPELEITVKQGNKFLLTDTGIALLDKNFIDNPIQTHIKPDTEAIIEDVKSDTISNNNLNPELEKYIETLFKRFLNENKQSLNELEAESITSSRPDNVSKDKEDLKRQLTELRKAYAELKEANTELEKENTDLKNKRNLLRVAVHNKQAQIDLLKDQLNQMKEITDTVLEHSLKLTSQQQELQALSIKSSKASGMTEDDLKDAERLPETKEVIKAEVIEPEPYPDKPPYKKRKSFWSRLFN